MNRRGFLQSILVAAAAPAIVRADSLMPFRPTAKLITPGSSAWLGAIREMSGYDISRDSTMYRWDVVGMVGGTLQQFTVSLDDYPTSRPLYRSSPDAPVVTEFPAAIQHSAEHLRAIAVEKLRRKVNESGMRVRTGILRIDGNHPARFLA